MYLACQHIFRFSANASPRACRARNTTETKVCSRIGLSAKRALHLALAGPRAIDVYRLCQIADVLDVSLDWLTGRSNVMDVMEMPDNIAEER
jgi:hypothetical protein